MQLMKNIAAIIAAAPMMAYAASQINAEQVTCSGTQTTDTTNGLQIACAGSLTIFGGSLTSDEDINLTASDALYLDAVTLTTAKNISLTGSSVSVGSNAKLDGQQLTINSTQDCVNAGLIAGALNCNTNIVNTGVIGGSVVTDNNHLVLPVRPGSLGDNGVVPVGNITGTPGAAISVGGWSDSSIIPRDVTLVGIANGEKTVINYGGRAACQATGVPAIFKMIEAGSRYCAGGKTQFHQVRFLRTTAECHNLPGTVELAPTQDFPMDSSTIQSTAQCSDVGGMLSSCLLYDAVDGGSNPIQQPSVGRLELKWGKKGDLRKLEARIIEKTSDDCHSESTLKFVKKM